MPTSSPAPVNLGPAQRIPAGEGRVFTIGALRVAVFRMRDGSLFATQAECPHRNGPLADGLVGGGVLVCPMHALRWELSTGAPVGNDCPGLATFPVALSEGGDVLLSVGAGA